MVTNTCFSGSETSAVRVSTQTSRFRIQRLGRDVFFPEALQTPTQPSFPPTEPSTRRGTYWDTFRSRLGPPTVTWTCSHSGLVLCLHRYRAPSMTLCITGPQDVRELRLDWIVCVGWLDYWGSGVVGAVLIYAWLLNIPDLGMSEASFFDKCKRSLPRLQ